MNKIEIGFKLIDSGGWTGGYNYQYNLIKALDEFSSQRIKSTIFCPPNTKESDLLPFRKLRSVRIVKTLCFSKSIMRRVFYSIFWGFDPRIDKELKKQNIKVLFEVADYYGWRFSIPILSWIPDFQHKVLRENFSFLSFYKREIGFILQLLTRKVVILSSNDAKKDCLNFYPYLRAKLDVVNFSTHVPIEFLAKNPFKTHKKYGIPDKYFYLPNQFWVHKNHSVAIRALAELKMRGVNISLVMTGSTENAYDENYFSGLLELVNKSNVENDLYILGMIPRNDVISLLRCSVALLNPSRFEGWSSTVEEAKYFEVPMILSNINLHIEQTEGKEMYFSPDDHQALADSMEKMINLDGCVSVRNQSNKVLEASKIFARKFSNSIYALVDEQI